MKQNDSVRLSSAEWTVMESLWEKSPRTGRDVVAQMQDLCGWNRSTTLTLLSRMEAKGAVGFNYDLGVKSFYPLISRDDAALLETEDFLERIYKGSVSMMVSALTRKQSLSQKEIDELYAILKETEDNTNA